MKPPKPNKEEDNRNGKNFLRFDDLWIAVPVYQAATDHSDSFRRRKLMAKVIDKETKAGKKFRQEIEKLKKLQVRVGYQRGEENIESEGESADLCDIAVYNELGTENIPSRPFMRDSVDNHAEQINAFLKKQMALLAKGDTTAEQMMKSIGVFQKGLVQAEIVDGDFEPNAPSTIKKKGSDKPLIDTGKMRQSVNFVIVKK